MKTFRIEVLKKVSVFVEEADIQAASKRAQDIVSQNLDTKLLGVVDVEHEALEKAKTIEVSIL